MNINLAMVTSVNGKITRDEETSIFSWTSVEDQQHFMTLKKEFDVIVMGSRTYEAAREIIKTQPGSMRIVLTTRPDAYQPEQKVGQIEFTNEEPKVLVERLALAGYTKILVVGGGVINTLFFQQQLVDEVILTIEPLIWGVGKNLVTTELPNVALQLTELKQLNEKGTLLLKYQVLKS